MTSRGAQGQPGRGEFSLRLDDQICFDLYAASRAVTGLYRSLLARLDLTYPQYLVMLVLWERGACSIRELGVALHLDYGTLSPLVKRLEAAGLLTRERHPDDERTVTVRPTDSGVALREQARTVPPAVGQALGLSNAELDRLRSTLRELTASVSAYANPRDQASA